MIEVFPVVFQGPNGCLVGADFDHDRHAEVDAWRLAMVVCRIIDIARADPIAVQWITSFKGGLGVAVDPVKAFDYFNRNWVKIKDTR